MKKTQWANRFLEFIILLTTISCLFILYTYRGASIYKIENSNINNEVGYTYFHNYYGESDNNEFESKFSQKEQNQILKDMSNSLIETDYKYLLDFSLGINNINTIIMNSNTIHNFNLSDKIYKGVMTQGNIDINSSEEMLIPVVVGYNLKGQYNIGDTIKTNIYNNEITFSVIGILEQDTKINFMYFLEILDDLIIVPQINFINKPNNREEYQLQNYILSCQCNGYFRYDKINTYEEIKNFCEDIANQYGIEWRCSNKIENKLANVEIPINLEKVNLSIILVYVTATFFLSFVLFYRKEQLADKKDPLIKVQSKKTAFSIIILIVIYELALVLLKTVLKDSIYYSFLLDNRIFTLISIMIYAIAREVFSWRRLNKLMEDYD